VLTVAVAPRVDRLKLTPSLRPLAADGVSPRSNTGEPTLNADFRRRSSDAAASSATRYGYFVNWDETSFPSLKRNAQSLDYVIAEWLHLTGPDGAITRDNPNKETLVKRWVKEHAPGLGLLPLVNNYDPQRERWDSGRIAGMLASDEARANFGQALYQYVTTGGFPGLVLDLEEFPQSAHAGYTKLIQELASLFRSSDLQLLVAVPADDPLYDYATLAKAADALIVMSYDEHTEHGRPGPLASQGWFESILDKRFRDIPNAMTS
jgi:spore germination protein YaaH